MFQASFHSIVTLRVFYYAPPDTGVSDLRTVAFEYLQSIEGAVWICQAAPFLRGSSLDLYASKPSPMRGRWHGEAVTDEVEAVSPT